MSNKSVVLGLILALGMQGCTRDTQRQSNAAGNIEQATLRLGWIPSGSFAGEVTGMNLFDEQHGLDLSIQPGGPGLNTITLVQTGESTFGTIAADEVLAANEKGADLVIIGVINYYSPGGFVSLKDRGITKPKDFEGRKVGLLPFGSTTMLYESLLAKHGVDRRKIDELAISPDMRPFLQGAYDVHPVFVYDETVTLDLQGIGYNLIEPKNFGVEFKGPVYFTTRRTLQERPEAVKAFVRTVVDGWNYALMHHEEAIGYLKKFAPEIDQAREARVLAKGAEYFRGYQGQPVNSDVDSWRLMIAEMRQLRKLSRDVNLDSTLHLQDVSEYYAEKQSPAAQGQR